MSIQTGNLNEEGRSYRSWVIGHFRDQHSPLFNEQFEVRWAKHAKGERKDPPKYNETAKTITVLVSGKFKVTFPGLSQEVVLENEGDYVFHDANVLHGSEALEDSFIITLRWPSVAGDQK